MNLHFLNEGVPRPPSEAGQGGTKTTVCTRQFRGLGGGLLGGGEGLAVQAAADLLNLLLQL